VSPSKHGSALGAAILGAIAAGQQVTGFKSIAEAIRGMQPKSARPILIRPRKREARVYDKVYSDYRRLAKALTELNNQTS
jgi:L-ribulokinase